MSQSTPVGYSGNTSSVNNVTNDIISAPGSVNNTSGNNSLGNGIAEARPPRAPTQTSMSIDISNKFKDGGNGNGNYSYANQLPSPASGYPISGSSSGSKSKAILANNNQVEGPTMGQMADAVQASARMASRNNGARTSQSYQSNHNQYNSHLDTGNSYMDMMGDDDNGDMGDDICLPGNEHTGRWTRKEHELFLDALKKYGKEWKKVASAVKTRTVVQTRTHAQKYFQKVHKSGFGGGYSDDDAFDSSTGTGGSGHSAGRASGGGGSGSGSGRRTSKRQRRPTEPRRNVAQAYHHMHSGTSLYTQNDSHLKSVLRLVNAALAVFHFSFRTN